MLNTSLLLPSFFHDRNCLFDEYLSICWIHHQYFHEHFMVQIDDVVKLLVLGWFEHPDLMISS